MWNEKGDILASMLENVHKNESTLQKNPPSGNLSSWIWPGGKLFFLECWFQLWPLFCTIDVLSSRLFNLHPFVRGSFAPPIQHPSMVTGQTLAQQAEEVRAWVLWRHVRPGARQGFRPEGASGFTAKNKLCKEDYIFDVKYLFEKK